MNISHENTNYENQLKNTPVTEVESSVKCTQDVGSPGPDSATSRLYHTFKRNYLHSCGAHTYTQAHTYTHKKQIRN